jgi:NAD(P)-dependent dehydrogenase (short-subunit alcohol dehydrogenase family)
MNEEWGLTGKVAIVTGGGAQADGIGNGRAACILLARAGAHVMVVDRDLGLAERTVAMIEAEGGTAVAASYDVTISAQCDAMVADAVSRWGRWTAWTTMWASAARAPWSGRGLTAYSVSKSAVIGLTKAIAVDHGADGVRANCVAPGVVYTPMVYARGMTEEARDIRRRASVLKREGTGWDIGAAIRFLLSDQARYITGHTLVVDGGATVVGPSRAS